MKLKLKMFIKNSRKIMSYLNAVIIKKIQNITIMQITVVGKMKHVLLLSKDFLGLKPKIHTFITEDNHESKKGKVINKNAFDAIKIY